MMESMTAKKAIMSSPGRAEVILMNRLLVARMENIYFGLNMVGYK